MKTLSTIFFLAIVLFVTTVVRADVDYFKQPADNQVFTAGSSTEFIVSQLPDIDGKQINANLYPEGRPELVMTIESWTPGSVSDNEKNDFTFTWKIPTNLKPGKYFVKIDINNDQDDNDICRSKTFEVTGGSPMRSGGAGTNAYPGPGAVGTTGTRVTSSGGGGGGGGAVGGTSEFMGGNNRAAEYNRPSQYVRTGMKTSTSGGRPGMNPNAGQRYTGSRYNGMGSSGGNTFNAIHLRRAK